MDKDYSKSLVKLCSIIGIKCYGKLISNQCTLVVDYFLLTVCPKVFHSLDINTQQVILCADYQMKSQIFHLLFRKLESYIHNLRVSTRNNCSTANL